MSQLYYNTSELPVGAKAIGQETAFIIDSYPL